VAMARAVTARAGGRWVVSRPVEAAAAGSSDRVE
jgi:hypothetical protein